MREENQPGSPKQNGDPPRHAMLAFGLGGRLSGLTLHLLSLMLLLEGAITGSPILILFTAFPGALPEFCYGDQKGNPLPSL